MSAPWAADVQCLTRDGSYSGRVRIYMIAHTSSGDYYSFGEESCALFQAPYYGHEFFRSASVSVTLRIEPIDGDIAMWRAALIKL